MPSASERRSPETSGSLPQQRQNARGGVRQSRCARRVAAHAHRAPSMHRWNGTAGAECVSAPIEMRSAPVARVRRDVLERDAAGDLDREPTAHQLHQRGRLIHRAVVEQHGVGAGRQGGFDLGRGAALDLHEQADRSVGTRALHGGGGAARERHVRVLDQDAVIEPEAVVGPAPGAHRVLLEQAKPGRGLARVDDRGSCPRDGVHEASGERGDAGQVLHQVEQHTLAGEDAPRRVH